MSPACSLDGCEKAIVTRELCGMHYRRLQRHGDPMHAPRWDADPEERFWSRVDVGHPAACWWWAGKVNNNGYGTLPVGRRTLGEAHVVIAHRYAYESLIGLIAPGLQLDHLCRNRLCVNPDHLEPVTPGENTRRAASAKKTHCKRGHAFNEANTYIVPGTGRRSCHTCRNTVLRAGWVAA